MILHQTKHLAATDPGHIAARLFAAQLGVPFCDCDDCITHRVLCTFVERGSPHLGRVLDATGNNYTIVFFACASVYVIATAIIHFILPRRRASIVAADDALVSVS